MNLFKTTFFFFFKKSNFPFCVNTRSKQSTVQLPRMKLEFGRQSFYVLAALCFNSLLLDMRSLASTNLFKQQLNVHSMCCTIYRTFNENLVSFLYRFVDFMLQNPNENSALALKAYPVEIFFLLLLFLLTY